MKIIAEFFLLIELLLLAIIGISIVILVVREIIIYLIKIFITIKLSVKQFIKKIHRSSEILLR